MKTLEQIRTEYERQTPRGLILTGLDIPFRDIFVLAVKVWVAWTAVGGAFALVAYVLWQLVTTG